MVVLLLYLHLLAQLYTTLLLSLALARLEDGLCHRKVTHLPLLHQLLYHCLQMCVLDKTELHAVCCAPSAHHADRCMPQVRVSMHEKLRNFFCIRCCISTSRMSHCLTLCCNAQQQLQLCFMGPFSCVRGSWQASMKDCKKLAYAVHDCHQACQESL